MKTVSDYPNIVPDTETEYLVEQPGGSTGNVSQAELDKRYTPVNHTETYEHDNLPTDDEKAAFPVTASADNPLVVDNDSRLSNSRTPLSHAASHASGQSDALTPAAIGAEAANSNIQTHVASAHAPANAQKNSDILQSEIEAKLTGTVSSHDHAATYYTKDTLDTKLNLMTEAAFEALAANRRSQYAGSGFVEWGGNSPTADQNVNQGLNAVGTAGGSLYANIFYLGFEGTKPRICTNGYRSLLSGIQRQDGAFFADRVMTWLPPAPATADLLDRQDLVFLEVWHEDISEKDFVYPYGNVQFGATSYTPPGGTGISCVNGAFTGFGTYSLFGNWQASSALIGKGIKWSTMTEAQKRAFAADPENNLYYTADNKIVQVRYRVRVVEGLGSSWSNTTASAKHYNRNKYGLAYSVPTAWAAAKGKATSISADLGEENQAYWTDYNLYNTAVVNRVQDPTVFYARELNKAHKGLCFAIPIALVQRRNQGAYHPVFNPNGSACFWSFGSTDITNGSANFYDAVHVSGASGGMKSHPASVADCFDFSSTMSESISTAGLVRKTSGAIGDTTRGRPDSLSYDEINERDVLDLRNSAHRAEDFKRLLEKEFARTVAGTMRGWERDQSGIVNLGNDFSVRFRYSAPFTYSTTNYHVSGWPSTLYKGALRPICLTDSLGTDVAVIVPLYNGINGLSLKSVYWLSDGAEFAGTESFCSQLESRLALTTFYDDGLNYRSYNELRVLGSSDSAFSSKTLLHCDIIGDPANYPQSWKDNGIAGTPLLVGENGENLIPDGTSKTWKASRKVLGTTTKLILESADSGATWSVLTAKTMDATNNIAGPGAIALGVIRLTFYLTEASPMTLATNAEVVSLGDVWAGNAASGVQGVGLISDIIGKIPTASISPYLHIMNVPLTRMSLFEGVLSPAAGHPVLHGIIDLTVAPTPAAKVLPYLTRANGKAYLQLLYKEMKHNGTSWGDDAKFSVIDQEGATTDLNGNTIKIGQKRIDLPYFIGDSE